MPYAQLDESGRVQAVTDQPIGIPCEWSDIGRRWTGATFEDVPAGPPAVISPRQFRLALASAGLLDAVEAAVAAADQATRITWEYATEVRRSDPLLGAMATAMGKTDAEVDSLFALGAGL